jgi:hypothetical protein
MPDLIPQFTASPSPPPPTPPPTLPPDWPALPPVIDPSTWESFSLFRETALIYVSEPEFNGALRKVGDYFYGMLLECYHDWPAWKESSTRTELRAAVADLRALQGFLASVGQERHLSSLSPEDARLSRHASKLARLLHQVADTLERELAKGAA